MFSLPFNISKRFYRFGFSVLIWCFFSLMAHAQRPEKKDYIILSDSILTQGKVNGLPTENNTQITFSRSGRSGSVTYGLSDVSEFRMSERLFFSKRFLFQGNEIIRYLEKLPHAVRGISIWRLNGKPNVFFVETATGLEELGEDYKSILAKAYGDEKLLPLIDITSRSELSLNYLAKTAQSLTSPRTFTQLLTITPWVGLGAHSLEFLIPDSTFPGKISGSSPTFGFNSELFLTFKRNLSVGIGLSWSKLDSQDFFNYTIKQVPYESDVFVDFSMIQVPMTLRYYYDFRPNRYRFFAEAGFSYGLPSYEKTGIFQAEIRGNSITTSSKNFQLSETYTGFIWGGGVEKYLSRHRGVTLGLRQSGLRGKDGESFNSLNFYMGYKF